MSKAGQLNRKGCLQAELRAAAVGEVLLSPGTNSTFPAPGQERCEEEDYLRKGSSMEALHPSYRAPSQQPWCNFWLTRCS